MSENEEFEFRLRLERERGGQTPAPQAAPTAQQPARQPPVQQFLGNLGAGALRGAGSIGATLLTPYDLLRGNTKSLGNPERRADMDAALQELGADTGSVAYGAGKLGGKIDRWLKSKWTNAKCDVCGNKTEVTNPKEYIWR